MEPFPTPQPPTKEEVIAENKILRLLLLVIPSFLLSSLIGIALLIAICVALNFNPMNWLE